MMSKKFIAIVIALFVLLQSPLLMAEQNEYRGKVLKFNGDVEVINAKGETRVVKNVAEPLNEMDTIVTKEGALIVVQFNDGALSVLDEKSRLRVEKTRWLTYLGGKVYFTYKRLFGEARRVRTRAATISVRGTTFVVTENDEHNGESVALKEGLLFVESTGPVFEMHKQRVLSEFEQSRQQARREFIEYRRQFFLRPNHVIKLSGYRVDESVMTDASQADFESFEAKAEDSIKAFRIKTGNERRYKNR